MTPVSVKFFKDLLHVAGIDSDNIGESRVKILYKDFERVFAKFISHHYQKLLLHSVRGDKFEVISTDTYSDGFEISTGGWRDIKGDMSATYPSSFEVAISRIVPQSVIYTFLELWMKKQLKAQKIQWGSINPKHLAVLFDDIWLELDIPVPGGMTDFMMGTYIDFITDNTEIEGSFEKEEMEEVRAGYRFGGSILGRSVSLSGTNFIFESVLYGETFIEDLEDDRGVISRQASRHQSVRIAQRYMQRLNSRQHSS